MKGRVYIIDSIICLVLGIIFHFFLLYNEKILKFIEKIDSKSLLDNMVNSSIGLAGFTLAALTIIITFKDSSDQLVKQLEDRLKKPDTSTSDIAKQMDRKTKIGILLTGDNYTKITRAMIAGCIIFFIIYIMSSVFVSIKNQISCKIIVPYIFSCLLLFLLTMMRILMHMRKIVKIDQ